MTKRQRTSSGGPFERRFAYCRAVRVGDTIHVSGTAAVEPDGRVTPGGMGAQTARCLNIIDDALADLGGSLADVVRVRMYVTDIGQHEETGDHLRAAFGDHPPAATMVEVTGLIDPAMMIEIEADAIIDAGD